MDFGEIYKYSEGHTFHEADANFKIIEFDLLKISENINCRKNLLKIT